MRATKRANLHDALRHARASAGAVVMHFRAVQATIMFDRSDKTAVGTGALLGKQVGAMAVENSTAMASPLDE